LPAHITSRRYDLVFCNSAIEHVGGHERRQRFAWRRLSGDDRGCPLSIQPGRRAWCTATTPMVRFRQRTARHPAAVIRRASSGWAGQSEIDSAR
jgi:hypothetical protein